MTGVNHHEEAARRLFDVEHPSPAQIARAKTIMYAIDYGASNTKIREIFQIGIHDTRINKVRNYMGLEDQTTAGAARRLAVAFRQLGATIGQFRPEGYVERSGNYVGAFLQNGSGVDIYLHSWAFPISISYFSLGHELRIQILCINIYWYMPEPENVRKWWNTKVLRKKEKHCNLFPECAPDCTQEHEIYQRTNYGSF